jgi:hypothetical protein
MKNLSLVVLLALACLQYGCQDEEQPQPLRSAEVQFSVDAVSVNPSSGGRAQASQGFPQGTKLRISIQQSDGTVVYSLKMVELIQIGDSYISEPLMLQEGSYKVTDYIIVGPGNQALFVAPKAGAAMAEFVGQPLPRAFTLLGSTVNHISVEVVDASLATPEDFGYISFPVDIAPVTGFALSVFKPGLQQSVAYAAATAYITHGADTVHRQTLAPKVNPVIWNAQDTATYSLSVVQPGYAPYYRTFKLRELKETLGSRPLVAVLAPALTIAIKPYPENPSRIQLTAPVGTSFRVDWGDGTQETISIRPGEYEPITHFDHTYPAARTYQISVTENLAAITDLTMWYQRVDTISIVHLPGLKVLSLSAMVIDSKGIDISQNRWLQKIDLYWANTRLRDLDISQNPVLSYIDLGGAPLSSQAMNKLVDNLYTSIVANNRTGGYVNFWSANSYLIGPPSQASFDKLHKMINQHGWRVHPIN